MPALRRPDPIDQILGHLGLPTEPPQPDLWLDVGPDLDWSLSSTRRTTVTTEA